MTREQMATFIATHEAGHAITAMALGLTVERVCCRLDPAFGMTYLAKQEPGETVQFGYMEGIGAGRVPLMVNLSKNPAASGIVSLAGELACQIGGVSGFFQKKDRDNARMEAQFVAASPGETRSAETLFDEWREEARRILTECAEPLRFLTEALKQGMLERNEVSIIPRKP